MRYFIAGSTWFFGFESAQPEPLTLLAEVKDELARLAENLEYDESERDAVDGEARYVGDIANLIDRYLEKRATCVYARPLTRQELEFYRNHPRSEDLITIPTYASNDHDA